MLPYSLCFFMSKVCDILVISLLIKRRCLEKTSKKINSRRTTVMRLCTNCSYSMFMDKHKLHFDYYTASQYPTSCLREDRVFRRQACRGTPPAKLGDFKSYIQWMASTHREGLGEQDIGRNAYLLAVDAR